MNIIEFQKFLWKIKNIKVQIIFFLKNFFNIFPSWVKSEKDIYKDWDEIFSEDFISIDESRWHILESGNWGSARPDNICVYVPENVFCENNILKIISKKQTAIGKGWDGESIIREFTSGYIESTFNVEMDCLYRAKIKCQKDLGSWKAYWLFKADGDDKRYQEIDGFEQFASSKKSLKTWSSTVHWGPDGDNRSMFMREVTYNTDDWLIFDIIVTANRVVIQINGVTCFISGIGVPKLTDKMKVIFGDAVTYHSGYVNKKEIEEGLPFLMEVDYFKIFRKKNTRV